MLMSTYDTLDNTLRRANFICLVLGDANTISKTADCQIIQKKLQKLYIKTMWTNFSRSLCKRKTIVGHKDKQTLLLYPNKFAGGCFVKEKDNFLAKLNAYYTGHFVLGCYNIRRTLLALFEE